jgi:predicted metal-dependent phosphoesterase TrpH
MPLLRGNLHTHTSLSDGTMGAEEIVERYRALGYDFIAFTDHRCYVGPGDEAKLAYWAKLPAGSGDFVVLHGIEEEPPELNGRHVGVITAGDEELRILNHPSEYGLTVPEVVDAVRRVGAHAVEVTYHGRYHAQYDSPEIAVPKIATDDMHYAGEIGVSWIEVDAERDPQAILRAIKAGAFTKRLGR